MMPHWGIGLEDTHMSKLTLHFKRPKHWGSSIRMHYWGTRPQVDATSWPGVPMRAIGDDWFAYAIQGVESASVVFTDGEGQQTSDLCRERDGWYTLSGGWSADDPEAVVPPTAVKSRSRGGCSSTTQ